MNIVYIPVQLDQMVLKGNNKVVIRWISKVVFWSMAIKNTPGQLPLNYHFFQYLLGLHSWNIASVSGAPSTRGIWACYSRFRERPWKLKRLEHLSCDKRLRELGFTLEKSRQAPGRPYSSMPVYKEVHKTGKKRLFTSQ